MKSYEFEGIESEVGRIWDGNAEFRDRRMGEGNRWYRELIAPNQERLLGLKDGDLVLDVGCGNGNFARRMVTLGASVVAFDVSEKMIESAKARTSVDAERVEYHVVDATDEDAIRSLGERRFDAAVCTQVIMDIPRIDPMLSALGHVLKPGGRFIFSLLHPCFNSTSTKFVLEESEQDGVVRADYSLKIDEYIQPRRSRGQGIVGQPEPHYYFSRPLSVLFNACFDAGFVLDGIVEPVFSRLDSDKERPSPTNWFNQSEIPPVLIARMRLPAD